MNFCHRCADRQPALLYHRKQNVAESGILSSNTRERKHENWEGYTNDFSWGGTCFESRCDVDSNLTISRFVMYTVVCVNGGRGDWSDVISVTWILWRRTWLCQGHATNRVRIRWWSDWLPGTSPRGPCLDAVTTTLYILLKTRFGQQEGMEEIRVNASTLKTCSFFQDGLEMNISTLARKTRFVQQEGLEEINVKTSTLRI